MNSKVIDWYEQKEHIDEMKSWDKGKLKIWEQQVADRFPRGAKILDIGSGMGREAFSLYKQGFEVIGLDISNYAVEKAREESWKANNKVEFYHYDGNLFPFDDEAFDIVILWNQTFGLLYGDDYKKSFLLECKRVLKPGGLFSYSGHDLKYIREHYDYCLDDDKFYPYQERDIYWETFSLEELVNYTKQNDFNILMSGQGEIYVPEDGVVLYCLCQKGSGFQMKKDSSTECWSKVGAEEWIKAAQNNDFRNYFIMPFTLQAMGEVKEKHILDMGCGEGGYARALAEKGAVVTAVDCSDTMLAYVDDQAIKTGLDIKTLLQNSNDLNKVMDNEYDIVLCSMMLMDVEDLEGTLKEIHRVLKPTGKVFISILHPCYKPKESKWIIEEDGIRVVVTDYFYPTEWIGEIKGISAPVVYRHRTLSDYVKAFTRFGFLLTDMNEPIPTKEQMEHSKRIEWLSKIPMYLFMELENK
ncbi:MAG: putative methylase [Herbinix sp.]|nr:putative methylase [Herbinix sp.]